MGFFGTLFSSLGKSGKIAYLGSKYKDNPRNPNAVPELYEYIMSHDTLRTVMQKHNATLQDLEKIYELLLVSCCYEEKGHFLPISALLFGQPLDYLLTNKDNANIYEIENYVYNYFH